jgi:hypothetical protein
MNKNILNLDEYYFLIIYEKISRWISLLVNWISGEKMLFERNEINWVYKSLFNWREIFKASKFISYFMIIDEVGSWFLAKKFVGKNSD